VIENEPPIHLQKGVDYALAIFNVLKLAMAFGLVTQAWFPCRDKEPLFKIISSKAKG
jgi:hypothetical protein